MWTILLGGVALAWTAGVIRAIHGMRRLPKLQDAPLSGAKGAGRISVVIPARDEQAALPAALESLTAQIYPDVEILVVNDRSRDLTPLIADRFASRHKQVHALHIRDLPSGWLGKPHALTEGYRQSTGEWLLFTDADIIFGSDTIARALSLARSRNWEYLTLLPRPIMTGFWERAVLTYWGIGFVTAYKSWKVADPRSRAYVGLGAFQLIQRGAYERIGSHERLAQEVVEDILLAKLAKFGGVRCGVGVASEHLSLRWFPGILPLIRGLTKNFYAAHNYSPALLISRVLLSTLFSIVPFAALFASRGWGRFFAATSVTAAVGFQAGCAWQNRVPIWYGLTHPVGSLLNSYMMLRSMYFNLRDKGIWWRDTFYPLDELIRARRALPTAPEPWSSLPPIEAAGPEVR